VGVEPKKLRTCVVVSNDIANRFAAGVTVVPTQRYTAERAGRAYMIDLRGDRSGLDEDRVANASTVMTYDRRRLRGPSISSLDDEALDELNDALRLHLAL